MEYKNDDFILKVNDASQQVEAIVLKYEAFLDAITTEKFEHVREAIRQAIRFFVSAKYPTTEVLAREHYNNSQKMQAKYLTIDTYLSKIKIRDRKSVSIDLATGTGKSWVIYGVAQIMLAEGLVDKVLVLCPSLTIEEGLKYKFLKLSGNSTVAKILQELGALHITPEIKNANNPILTGDICVENIHAVYERTGSSIRDSFIGKGDRTLVISDEAHHIYSPEDAGLRKWLEFLTDSEFNFKYHLGLTGTPYFRNADNDYFHDIIYRYGIKKATEEGIIKSINYVLERAFEDETRYDETYQNHKALIKQYKGVLRPITIVVTAKIVECVKEWETIVEYIVEKEKVSFEAAAKKVIWVTSGLPANKDEREEVLAILPEAEKIRKKNLQELKSVDAEDSMTEWIVSVAMLTEGWDVKNVFQIVPHSSRAFNSKLLIAQVLGRGLRIPDGLIPPVHVKVNNHERFTPAIEKLYKEVLEIENQITWGIDSRRSSFLFPLFTLEYEQEQYAIESKKKKASEPFIKTLHPQQCIREQRVIYSQTGIDRYDVTVFGNVAIKDAARQIKLFLKEKDPELAAKWSISKIERFIAESLSSRGYDPSFVSSENLTIIKQSFGPIFRELGKEVPRMRLKSGALKPVNMAEMQRQFFSEDSIKNEGAIFYTSDSVKNLTKAEKEIIGKYIENRARIKSSADVLSDIEYVFRNFHPQTKNAFKTPLNIIYTRYKPEREFMKDVFMNVNLFDSFIKSPDKNFYGIPYSYKPTEEGMTHVKRGNFNPDFFLLVKDTKNILVVEVKGDEDTVQENKAKYRDGKDHFNQLNTELTASKVEWQYHFFFLSPENYADFFQAIKDNKYKGWKSELMQELE